MLRARFGCDLIEPLVRKCSNLTACHSRSVMVRSDFNNIVTIVMFWDVASLFHCQVEATTFIGWNLYCATYNRCAITLVESAAISKAGQPSTRRAVTIDQLQWIYNITITYNTAVLTNTRNAMIQYHQILCKYVTIIENIMQIIMSYRCAHIIVTGLFRIVI